MSHETQVGLVMFGAWAVLALLIVGAQLWLRSRALRVLREGDAAFVSGDLEAAERCYSKGLDRGQSKVGSHLRLGLLYLKQGHPGLSTAAVLDALRADESVKYEAVEKLARQLRLDAAERLCALFREAEMTYLSRLLSTHRNPVNADSDAPGPLHDHTSAVQLQKHYAGAEPLPADPTSYILLEANECGERFVIRAATTSQPGGATSATMSYKPNEGRLDLFITIHGQPRSFVTSMLDAHHTLAPGESRVLTDATLTSLLGGGHVELRSMLEDMAEDASRMVHRLERFCRGRLLAQDIGDITLQILKILPVYWHEGKHGFEFTREKFSYRLVTWPGRACSATWTHTCRLNALPRD